MSNSQRAAIITGASQGIGERLVSGYCKLGHAVGDQLPPIADSDDPMVLTVPGDVAEPGVGQRNVDTALERFGRIDTVNISTSLVDHATTRRCSRRWRR